MLAKASSNAITIAGKVASSEKPWKEGFLDLPLKMRKSVVYRRCLNLYTELVRLCPNGVVSVRDLKLLIQTRIGADERTVRAYMRRLVAWKMILQTSHPQRYYINLMKPGLRDQKVLPFHRE